MGKWRKLKVLFWKVKFEVLRILGKYVKWMMGCMSAAQRRGLGTSLGVSSRPVVFQVYSS